jgi:hypothetical protein
MQKTLDLQIDASSWASAPLAFRKRCPFSTTQSATSIDFLTALLWAGTTAISIRMPQWWLASNWAILRYVGAADHTTNRLRLHAASEDLETHSKKVLSDDWGVGISLQWLAARLHYKEVAHGRFAMDDLKSKGQADFGRFRKRGPSKCPDFLAVDRQNKIDVIECKGNQDGLTQIRRQFADGLAQKNCLQFSNEAMVGQRLLTGVAIAGPASKWKTTLRVADPPPGSEEGAGNRSSLNKYLVRATSAESILPSLRNFSLLQGLLLAGAFGKAHPLFPGETNTLDSDVREDIPMDTFSANNVQWRGQVQEMLYTVPVRLTDGTLLGGSRLRFCVSGDLIERLEPWLLDKILGTESFDL